jgi:hypothetical protein
MSTASLVFLLYFAVPVGAIYGQVPSMTGQHEGGSALGYDQNRWKMIKQIRASFGGDTGLPSEVLLLKSVQPTGRGGGQPLSDVDLLIMQRGRVIYDYAQEAKSPGSRFYMDDYLEIRDVTGDGIPEVLFHSGSKGYSDSATAEHILRYDTSKASATDLAPVSFYNSGTHGLRWLVLADRAFVVIADRNWSPNAPLEDKCHYCPSPFKYNLYQWSSKEEDFVAYRQVYGEKLYQTADEALREDWALVQNSER